MKARSAWNRSIALVIVLVLLCLQGAALAATRITKIKLNATTATITIKKNERLGKTYQLKATITPSNASNKNLSWSSSNPSIAKVDKNGKVTSVRAGKVTITAKAKDGSGKKAACTITVKAPIYVTGVRLNQSSLTLFNTQDAKFPHACQLMANVSPINATKKTVKWTSSNASVAKVSSSGYVTVAGEGTTTITAAAQDGSGKKAACTITVKPPRYMVTGVKLNASSLTLYNTQDANFVHAYQLTATVSPSNATDKRVKWASSNTGVAQVSSSGYVTVTGEGATIITATAQDGSGQRAICVVSVMRLSVYSIYTKYIQPESDRIHDALSVNLSSKESAKLAFDAAQKALENLTTLCKQYPVLSTTALSYVNTMSTACGNALTRLETITSANDSTLESYQHGIMDTLLSFKYYVLSLP